MDTTLGFTVPPAVSLALKRAKLTSISSILEYSNGDLIRRTGLNEIQVQELVQMSSEAILSHTVPLTALDISQKVHQKLSVGCPIIDHWLDGGLLPFCLTELAGTSAAGKTQFCLQLALTVQLPSLEYGGFSGRAVYVSTEGALPIGRLKEMAQSMTRKCPHFKVDNLMDGILLQHCATIQELKVLLSHEILTLLQQSTDIKLLIIDSLAALFRVEYQTIEDPIRAQDLKSIGKSLHWLMYEHKLTIVCTNQMTGDVSTGTNCPALGTLWTNMVHMRLILLREEEVNDNAQFGAGVNPVSRTMKVDFAPHLPNKVMQYYIDEEGVCGIDIINSEFLNYDST